VLWRDYTQVRYYGVGPDTSETQLSDYRVRSTNLVGYTSWQLHPVVSVGASLGWLSRPRLSSSAGLFDRGDPDTQFAHPSDPAVSLPRQPEFTHGEFYIVVDTRDEARYPTHGSVARASLSTYRDHPSSGFAFNRYDVEGAYFIRVARRGVLAFRGWGAFSDTGDREAVPFYMLPSLGGHNTLRGYPDYRFHDRHLLVANVESRWPLFTHVDMALFFDAGSVAPTVSQLGLDRTSAGVGFRIHTRKSTLGRLDIAHGREGWRVMFKLSDAFRLSRFNARTALVPFVP
jgi:outer membrane protein assembly factor BamA